MEKEYEVIRLIKQDAGCHVITDCVQGEILAEYLCSQQQLEKEELFLYFRQMIKQLGYLQDVKDANLYRYVTPFSMIRKKNGQVMLLALNAKSNQHIVRQICKGSICDSFFKKDDFGNLMYSLGKTIQFLLAKTETIPPLTKWEEKRFKKIISKCLSDKSKKQYQKFSEILPDLPQIAKKNQKSNGKIKSIATVFAVIILIIVGGTVIPVNERKADSEAMPEQEDIDFLDIGITYFLELENYKKSKEMFASVKGNVWISGKYQDLADYMSGEGEKSGEEVEILLQEIEEERGEELDVRLARMLLRAYVKVDSPNARRQSIRLGEYILDAPGWREKDVDKKIENEIRSILAKLYEKTGETKLAMKNYERLSQWNPSEEVYISMIKIAKEENVREALEICERGILENPLSKELRIQSIQMQCKDKATTKETCEESISKMIVECPQLLEDREFLKLQEECGIQIEGEKVWVEK